MKVIKPTVWLLSMVLCFTSCGDSSSEEKSGGDSLAAKTAQAPVKAAETPSRMRYGIQSGMIEYTITGTMKGKEVCWFTDWGWTEARTRETTVMAGKMEMVTKIFTLLKDDLYYSIDLKQKKGSKIIYPGLAGMSPEDLKDLVKVGERMMKEMGGEKTGTETIMGKECEIWEIKAAGTKVWVWKNIALKTVADIATVKYEMIATGFQENIDVPGDQVDLPAGITEADITDMTNMLEHVK